MAFQVYALRQPRAVIMIGFSKAEKSALLSLAIPVEVLRVLLLLHSVQQPVYCQAIEVAYY
jgi:hypothetical protein